MKILLSTIILTVLFNTSAWAQSCPAIAAELLGSNEIAGDQFGWSVASEGDLVIVGTPGDQNNAGSVHVFRRDGLQWIEEVNLVSQDNAAGDFFGNSVSISGNIILVGAPGDDDNGSRSGSAYIFEFDGTNWNQLVKLLPFDGNATDFVGGWVSVSGNNAIISSERNDELGTNAGSAYIFTYDGTNWVHQVKLHPSDGEAYDSFSISVAIDANTAVIGASEDDDNGSASGSAYIFKFDGAFWVQDAKLVPDDSNASDFFGEAVAISGNKVIVGSYWNDQGGINAGAAYVFVDDGTQWTQEAKLLASDAMPRDQFGFSVDIAGDIAIVGANNADSAEIDSGAVYLYAYDGSQWNQTLKQIPDDALEADTFANAVAITNEIAVIGSVNHDEMGEDSGSVYITLYNQAGPADLNTDGTLNFFDISLFLQLFAAQDPAADFLPDGFFNFFDISVFLQAFSAGCS